MNPDCMILDNPIRVRLFIDDVHYLQKNNIDINKFIRETVRLHVIEIKNAGISGPCDVN